MDIVAHGSDPNKVGHPAAGAAHHRATSHGETGRGHPSAGVPALTAIAFGQPDEAQ